MPPVSKPAVRDPLQVIGSVEKKSSSLSGSEKSLVQSWVRHARLALRAANNLESFGQRKTERDRILGRALEIEAVLNIRSASARSAQLKQFLQKSGSSLNIPMGIRKIDAVLELAQVREFLFPFLKGNPIDKAVLINSGSSEAVQEVCRLLLLNGYVMQEVPQSNLEDTSGRTVLRVKAQRLSEPDYSNPEQLTNLLRTIGGFYYGSLVSDKVVADLKTNQFGITLPGSPGSSVSAYVFALSSASSKVPELLSKVQADLSPTPAEKSTAPEPAERSQVLNPKPEGSSAKPDSLVPNPASPSQTPTASPSAPAQFISVQSTVQYKGSIRFKPWEHSLGRKLQLGADDYRVKESTRFLGFDPEWNAPSRKGALDLSQIPGGIVLDGSSFEFGGVSKSMEDLSKSIQSWLSGSDSAWMEVVQRRKEFVYVFLKENHAYGTRYHVLAFDKHALEAEAAKLGKSLPEYMSLLLTRKTPVPSTLIPSPEGLGHVAFDVGNRGRSYLLADRNSDPDMHILETLTDSAQSWKLNAVRQLR